MKYSITDNGIKAKLVIEIDEIELIDAVKLVESAKVLCGNTLSVLDHKLIQLIKNEGLLQAVKYHKDQTGQDLKTSKDYCDDLKAKHGK